MDRFVLINNLVCQWNGECNGFERQLQGERVREREREVDRERERGATYRDRGLERERG